MDHRVGEADTDALDMGERLRLVGRAFASAPVDDDTPQMLISQCVRAVGAFGGVICHRQGDRLVIVASEGFTAAQRASCGDLLVGDETLPLTYAATAGQPVWLKSQAETAARFPRIVDLVPRADRAYAAIPLQVGDRVIGVLGLNYVTSHGFTDDERSFVLRLAALSAEHLGLWQDHRDVDLPSAGSAILGRLVQAMSMAESPEEVATVISVEGALAAGAVFANVASIVPGSDGLIARIVHSTTIAAEIAARYTTIPVDDSTPLGTAMRSGEEVWLPGLAHVDALFPALVADTKAAGLAATASLPLLDRFHNPLGALGLAWATPQTFTATRKEELRVIAGMVADGLDRANRLQDERGRRLAAERLRETLEALVGAETLTQVSRAVFDVGVPPLGATAARLALRDESDPDVLRTYESVGVAPAVLSAWETLPPGATPSSEAFRTSRIVYVATLDELAARFPLAYAELSGSGYQAWLALPLTNGRTALGALTLTFEEPHPFAASDDHVALSALTSAIGQALSRATARDEDRALVLAVQESLFSAPLPVVAGMRLHTTYLPAEKRFNVGGDWYDAVELVDGRLLLMVGDLAGHGLMAAITMGHLRSAARALAPRLQPAELLDELDRFATTLTDHTISTAACILVDPRARALHYSVAGHPPPLVRSPEGDVTALDGAQGLLLGVGGSARPQRSMPFLPGSALLLYTDGLIERRGEDLEIGMGRLSTAFYRSASTTIEESMRSILAEAGNPQPEDDVAALLALFD